MPYLSPSPTGRARRAGLTLLAALLGFASPLLAQPVNLALNRPVQVSSIKDPSTPGRFAVDGNRVDNNSRWVSSDGGYPHWIEIDLGVNATLSQFDFWTGFGTYGYPVSDFELQTWNGDGWVTVHAVTDSANAGVVSETFAPVVAGRRVRLLVTEGSDPWVRLFELEVFGEPLDLQVTAQTPTDGLALIDPTTPITIGFGSALAAVDLSGVKLVALPGLTTVAGVAASISGSNLVISHPALVPEGTYRVVVPAGAVAVAGNPAATNGPVTYDFSVAPSPPVLLASPTSGTDLAGPRTYTFDRTVAVVDPARITLRNLTTGTNVGGLVVSAAGAVVTVAHPTLTEDHHYRMAFEAGAVEGVFNGVDNLRATAEYFAGEIVILEASFTNGLEGFLTAKNLGLNTSPQAWRRDTARPGAGLDFTSILSTSFVSGDFAATPALALQADEVYNLRFVQELESTFHVGLNQVPTSDGATPVYTSTSLGRSTVNTTFTVPNDGDHHLVFSTVTGLYKDNSFDHVRVVRSIPPQVEILGPADGASFPETGAIAFLADAFGGAGKLTSVEFTVDGATIGTFTQPPYALDWTYHFPGPKTLGVIARNEYGLVATAEVDVTITFNDGSLPKFLHLDLDAGSEGFTGAIWGGSFGSLGTGGLRLSKPVSSLIAVSSPIVYLLAGETYTYSFDARANSGSASYPWAFLATTEPGYPASETGAIPFTINGATWVRQSVNFTVPADGAYHLSLFHPVATGGYDTVHLDNFRLVGNFNSAPLVTLTAPTQTVTTLAGADLVLAAAASDPDGTIDRVEFRYEDGGLVAPDAIATTAPFTYAWTNLPEGDHRILAVAIDTNGGVAQTGTRLVKVAPNRISLSSYLGGADTDERFTGAAYLADGTLVLSGILDPSLFPGVTPLYLHGSQPGDRGLVARLSADGTVIHSVTVVAPAVHDLDTDGQDRLFVAAGATGAVVLDPTASTVLFSVATSQLAHRIDAATGGTWAVLFSPGTHPLDNVIPSGVNHAYSSTFTLLGTFGGASANTTDLAVDEANGRVVMVGWRNIAAMEDNSTFGINPVDVPSMVARTYDGTEVFRAYDWGTESTGERWLNRVTNNMADTRGARVHVTDDGRIVAAIEFDGGNTPLRYHPFDLDVLVPVVGGDQYHLMANTSTVPKVFVGIYDAYTGGYQTGQWVTGRLTNGNDNTLRIKNGNVLVDDAGRIHIVGESAAGFPMTHDPLPGLYSGGAHHLVYSPDLSSREYATRYTVKGLAHAIAVSPSGEVAVVGSAENVAFLVNPVQGALTSIFDGFVTVGNLHDYYRFQQGEHPRLFFDADELAEIRSRLDREPYASMVAALEANRDAGNFYRPTVANSPGDLMLRAQASAFLYALLQNEADALSARVDVEQVFALMGTDWASPSLKGLDSYWHASKLAIVYDLCAGSDSWDAGFDFAVSRRLADIAAVIVESGGTEQNTAPESNWQGARGASGGLALLATDHTVPGSQLSSALSRTVGFLNANQGTNPASRGWNGEGSGYTAYAIGSFVGPFAIAVDRLRPTDSFTDHHGLRWITWPTFAGATTALDVYGLGGVKTDWTDDNAHVGGEGVYGLAFRLADPALLGGLRHAYDRFQGALSPLGPRWDGVRHGTFWSILYYPEEVLPQDPLESWTWHRAGAETAGIGMMTFRDGYADADDALVQFKARLRIVDGHDAPDGLGMRVIAAGSPFVIGGGRNNPGRSWNQATVYPSLPGAGTTTNDDTGSFVGVPLVKPDGGGHAIATMPINNVGSTSHTRRVVVDYDAAATGADAVIVVADTTGSGQYWQLPTFLNNNVVVNGNTFTITGTNGATLVGTILHPGGTPSVTVGTRARGDGYTLTNGGTLATEDPVTNPRILDNRYLLIQSGDGDFLVVMTIRRTGSHPSVTRLSGGVADAVVQVGTRTFTLLPDTVHYDGAPFTPAAAVVTFDAGDHGALTGAPSVQNVAYGASPTVPTVVADPDFVFAGWDKVPGPVVRSMTVTALYGEVERVPTAPTHLAATASSPTQVAVSWQDASLGEVSFELERSADGLAWAPLAFPVADAESYLDGGLLPETSYHYRLRAVGLDAPSAWVGPVLATTTSSGSNLPPEAVADIAEVLAGASVLIDVLANDLDEPGSVLTVASFTQGSSGTVVAEAGGLRYEPASGFTGQDTFSYVASDGDLEDGATVTVTVTPVGAGPALDFGALALDEGTDPDPPASGALLIDDAMDYGPSDVASPINGDWAGGSSKARYESSASYDRPFIHPAYRDSVAGGAFYASWNPWRGSHRLLGQSVAGEFWVSAIVSQDSVSGSVVIGPTPSGAGYLLSKDGFGLTANGSGQVVPAVFRVSGSTVTGSRTFAVGDAHLVLAKVTVGTGADSIRLWVRTPSDPIGPSEALLGTPDLEVVDADLGDVTSRLYLGSTGNGGGVFDDLRASADAGNAGLAAVLGVSASGSYALEDGGVTLALTGQQWLTAPADLAATPNTWLTFDFRSTVEAEAHVIGLVVDGVAQRYQVHGTEASPGATVVLPDYAPSAPGWLSYEIHLGADATGPATAWLFGLDHDAAPQTGDGRFRNVRLIEINPNLPPVAVDDEALGDEGQDLVVAVLDNDSDPEDVPTLLSVGSPAHGTANIVGGVIVYSPDPGFYGTDAFTYTITDGELEDSATVTVTIRQGFYTAAIDLTGLVVEDLEDPNPATPPVLVLDESMDYGTSDVATPINSDWAGSSNKARYESNPAPERAFVHGSYRDDTAGGTFFSSWSDWRGSSRRLGTTLVDEVWLSALVMNQASQGYAALSPNQGNTNYSINRDAFGLGWDGSALRAFHRDRSASTFTYGSRAFAVDVVHLVIAKLDVSATGADVLTLWIKAAGDSFGVAEADLGTPDLVITDADYGNAIDRVWLGSHASGIAVLDDLRVTDLTGDAGLEAILGVTEIGDHALENGDTELHLAGNIWKIADTTIVVGSTTRLALDFRAAPEGEIQGIGVVVGGVLTLFNFHGTENPAWVVDDYRDYAASAPGWRSYSIPLAAHVSGTVEALVFANEEDALPRDAESWFRQVRVLTGAPNAIPTATADSATVGAGGSVLVDVLANDTDDGVPYVPGVLSLAEVGSPAHGTATIEAGQVRYTPTSGYSGPDAFTYTITDGSFVATATVTVNVTP